MAQGDALADSLEADDDKSYGYVATLDKVATAQGEEAAELGVRFELRSLMSTLGLEKRGLKVTSSAGFTVDEFLLEAAHLVRFAAWLNAPADSRAPAHAAHSFWMTGKMGPGCPDCAAFEEEAGYGDELVALKETEQWWGPGPGPGSSPETKVCLRLVALTRLEQRKQRASNIAQFIFGGDLATCEAFISAKI